MQFVEKSFSIPFRFGRGFRQNPKWIFQNFQLARAELLVTPPLPVPTNGSNIEPVSKMQIKRRVIRCMPVFLAALQELVTSRKSFLERK